MVPCARNYKILASVSENLSPALGFVNPTQHSNIVRYILSGNSQHHLRYRGYHTVPEISTSITICPLAGYTKQQSCSKLNQGNNAPRPTSYSARCAPPLSYAAIYLPFVPVRHEYHWPSTHNTTPVFRARILKRISVGRRVEPFAVLILALLNRSRNLCGLCQIWIQGPMHWSLLFAPQSQLIWEPHGQWC